MQFFGKLWQKFCRISHRNFSWGETQAPPDPLRQAGGQTPQTPPHRQKLRSAVAEIGV